MSSSLFVSLLVCFMIGSCGGGTKTPTGDNAGQKTRQPAKTIAPPAPDLIRLTHPTPDQEISAGSEIRVRYQLTGRMVPDSVEIYFGGRLMKTLRDGSTEVNIPAESASTTGIRALKLLAYKDAERPQSLSLFVTILSDIVPRRHGYRVERTFPHDNQAYTQGLFWHDGYLYESTGQEGRSSLRKVELETGSVIRKHNLEPRFFGEGTTLVGNQIYQLTWQTKVGFIYDLGTFRELERFYYNNEGWGLTTMGDFLVMSDGSNKLYIIEPANFSTIRTIEVYDNKSMVTYLNELEYINDEIWSNIYLTDLIARIDPSTGKVLGYIDLAGIISDSERRVDGDDVLNGIAYDPENDRVFVTGKNWPKLFQIRLTEMP
ncbi:MAG: glutaminyl-peptide cyclotransferase [Bacteroidales bacterium]